MSYLDRLNASKTDVAVRTELLKECITHPAILHTVAEGLRTGSADVKEAALILLNDIATRKPDLLENFSGDLLSVAKDGPKKLTKQAMKVMTIAAPGMASELFAEREYLLKTAGEGGPVGMLALEIIAATCQASRNYRGKLFPQLLRLARKVDGKQLPKFVKSMGPAVQGSTENIKRLRDAISPAGDTLDEKAKKKLSSLLAKLER